MVKDNLPSYINAVCSDKRDGFIIAEVCAHGHLDFIPFVVTILYMYDIEHEG